MSVQCSVCLLDEDVFRHDIVQKGIHVYSHFDPMVNKMTGMTVPTEKYIRVCVNGKVTMKMGINKTKDSTRSERPFSHSNA